MHRHKAQIISDWFLEHDNEFTLLKWPPQSPDLNPIEHIWDVVEREIHIMHVQPTNLQQLCDAIMSIWTKISEEWGNENEDINVFQIHFSIIIFSRMFTERVFG